MSLIIENKIQPQAIPSTTSIKGSSFFNDLQPLSATKDDILNLHDKIADLEKNITNINLPNVNTPEDILKLNNKIANLEANISSIKPIDNTNSLTNLQSQVTLIKNDFTEFMKTSSTLQNTIMNQVIEIQKKEPIVNNITKEIINIDESRLNNIQQDLKQQTNALTQNITNNQNTINNNTSSISTNSVYIEQLKNQNTQLNTNITNISSQVTDITKSFENKITEQNNIIKNLQNNISNIQNNNTAVYHNSTTPAFYEEYTLNKKTEPKYFCIVM
jgi:trimeric autotransporter adhesin